MHPIRLHWIGDKEIESQAFVTKPEHLCKYALSEYYTWICKSLKKGVNVMSLKYNVSLSSKCTSTNFNVRECLEGCFKNKHVGYNNCVIQLMLCLQNIWKILHIKTNSSNITFISHTTAHTTTQNVKTK